MQHTRKGAHGVMAKMWAARLREARMRAAAACTAVRRAPRLRKRPCAASRMVSYTYHSILTVAPNVQLLCTKEYRLAR